MQKGEGGFIGKPLELALGLVGSCETPSQIHVLGICKQLGIKVFFRKFAEIDGLLVRKGDEIFIAVNENRSFARKRFTIAHEIGHFLMHKGESFDHSGKGDPKIEREADIFATNLLMPAKMIRKIHNQFRSLLTGMDVIPEMAWIFRVSNGAMKLRLSELKIIPKIQQL